MKSIIENIKTKFEISDISKKRDNLFFLTAEKKHLIELITYLKTIEKFTHLIMLSAVDWIEDNKFQLTYILNHPQKKCDLSIRVFIDRENPTMQSAHHIWPHIATDQRELKEMYGIDFPDSPRVNEEFILEGWQEIPPMRRDFDTLKYSEETFFPREGRKTYDTKEYMKSKLYPNG